MLNVAFSELKMKKGKVVLTNRGSIGTIDMKEAQKLSSYRSLKTRFLKSCT